MEQRMHPLPVLMDARSAAVAALLQVQQAGGYSHIVLSSLLEQTPLQGAERALTVRLVYGVTERRLTLDFLLNRVSSVPVKKMQPSIHAVLQVGVYQLMYMDKIPAFAAIHESVDLVKQLGFPRLAGFVNGVLRGVQQQGAALLSSLPDNDKGAELRYSCPRAWIRAWRAAYGETRAREILDSLQEAPPAFIRVNTLATTAEKFTALLETVGIGYDRVPGLPAALLIKDPQRLRETAPATQYYYQDLASQWCCESLGAQPGERIADVCAAPGGKSFTVAQYMQNSGSICASDLYDNRCEVLARRAEQLGLTCIQVRPRDASEPPEAAQEGQFDRVICDVPCSGLGVIRRKPEIRYKQPEDFAELPQLQLQILRQASRLVRPGGVLQYSTCTLRPEENEQVAAAFLQQETAFSPRTLPLQACFDAAGEPASHQITLFPPVHGTDGFYIAGFVKTGS